MTKSPLVNKIKNVVVRTFEELESLVAAVAFNAGCSINLDKVGTGFYMISDWDHRPMAEVSIVNK